MFKDKFKAIFAKIRQRGQVAVLFALLTPIFLMFTGLALDLGWYYLNVSRLQNAADAAAIAGAYKLREEDKEYFSTYKATLVNAYPAKDITEVNPDISKETGINLAAVREAKSVAKDYLDKNLANGDINSNITKDDEPFLYKKGDYLYFVVKVEEEIGHLFLSGWFKEPMPAPVTAVARLSKTA